MSCGGSLPPADLGYVRTYMPGSVKLAERYNSARAEYLLPDLSDQRSRELRREAEKLRDLLIAAETEALAHDSR